jgi:hypothetical protein
VLSNFGGAAVLDRETGLVWERQPLSAPDVPQIPPDTGERTLEAARAHCIGRTVGNRMGWRLPTIQELTSLIDPANTDGIGRRLPPGHPFSRIESDWYWSSTGSDSAAFGANLASGHIAVATRNVMDFVWCVRGGQGVDRQ